MTTEKCPNCGGTMNFLKLDYGWTGFSCSCGYASQRGELNKKGEYDGGIVIEDHWTPRLMEEYETMHQKYDEEDEPMNGQFEES